MIQESLAPGRLASLPVGLPPGYWTRPAVLDDAEAVAALMNGCWIARTGRPTIEAGEVRADWQSPTMNLETNTRLVFAPDGSAAAVAELWDSEPHVEGFVLVEVHPKHQGQGIGTVLARWADERGQCLLDVAPKDARVGLWQFVLSSDTATGRLLRYEGYRITRHNLRMVIDFAGPSPAPPAAPDGLLIRPFLRGQEERPLLAALREEFRDHWGYVESPFEDDFREWTHWMATSPTCDPSLYFVAVDGKQIAGTAFCQARWIEDPEAGWIHSLGVRRPWRRRGLAQALLRHCFVALYERGKRRAALGVDADSLTGATRLYESAGMRMKFQFDRYEKEMRAGRDLSTQAVE